MAQRLKCLPEMWETWVWYLGQEDPLEKEMTTHSSILAWRTPRTEEPGGLLSTGSKESNTTERLHFHFIFVFNSVLVYWASQVAQLYRVYLPVQETQETRVWSLGQEDPLKEEMATQLQNSCQKNPRGPGTWWTTICGHKELDITEHTQKHTQQTQKHNTEKYQA